MSNPYPWAVYANPHHDRVGAAYMIAQVATRREAIRLADAQRQAYHSIHIASLDVPAMMSSPLDRIVLKGHYQHTPTLIQQAKNAGYLPDTFLHDITCVWQDDQQYHHISYAHIIPFIDDTSITVRYIRAYQMVLTPMPIGIVLHAHGAVQYTTRMGQQQIYRNGGYLPNSGAVAHIHHHLDTIIDAQPFSSAHARVSARRLLHAHAIPDPSSIFPSSYILD